MSAGTFTLKTKEKGDIRFSDTPVDKFIKMEADGARFYVVFAEDKPKQEPALPPPEPVKVQETPPKQQEEPF